MVLFRLMFVSLRAQLHYPASFLMVTAAYFLGSFADIIGVWVLFDRFQMVKGWSLYEVGLIYGIVHIGFAIADMFSKGFDHFDLMIKHGTFDRLLLRPLSPLLQVATAEVQLLKIGRLVQGTIVLIWSSRHLPFPLLSPHTVVISLAILGTSCLFYGLLIVQATIAFWTTETLEVMNIATYGGVQAGQYPLSIYPRSFRWIFTLLIPLACVAYYPVAILLRHTTVPLLFAFIAPLAGGLFLYLTTQLWKLGVKHYHSTGS